MFFAFPVGRESHFEAVFMFLVGRESRFEGVFAFLVGRESRFEAVFQFRPWPKRCFCCFPLIRRGGKSIFVVFSVSAVVEMQLLLFSIRPPWWKVDFQHFLTFIHG